MKDPWQWPQNLPHWGKKHLCIQIRACSLREFLPTAINKEIGVKRTSFSQVLRLGSYLRPEWSRTFRPGDKGPPSARGARFGFYLRLKWSRKQIPQYHNTYMPALYERTLSLNYYTWGSISPILGLVVRMVGCTHTPSFAGSGARGPCINQSQV